MKLRQAQEAVIQSQEALSQKIDILAQDLGSVSKAFLLDAWRAHEASLKALQEFWEQ